MAHDRPFDPNQASLPGSGVFGLPTTFDDARLVYLPVPWEVTTSYGGGTSQGPRAILEASRQVDLFDLDVERPYAPGLFMLEESPEVQGWNARGKALAQGVIEAAGVVETDTLRADLAEVNELSARLDAWVRAEARRLREAGKIVAVVGGDHSVPFGAIADAAEAAGELGVLHVDAHSDTRDAYEGFARSHASIMRNVLEDVPEVVRLVQVGIRDVCEAEVAYVEARRERVRVFYDRDLAYAKLRGQRFEAEVARMVEALPAKVWVSFDVDGLDPRYCPGTGTPVPGGLDFHEAVFLVRAVVESGRTIVGFDLNEVAPNPDDPADDWDGNVGARLLYKLTGLTLASQGLAKLR